METYDDAAYERFCGDLVNEGFSPVRDTEQAVWSGPIRESLVPLTDATRMQIHFFPGWPLRYAHVIVDGIETEHAARGVICLWAEDDPAQVVGRDLQALWSRLDDWARTAQQGFRREDRALDAYLLFDAHSNYQAELPFGDLVRAGSNGFRAALTATRRGDRTLMIERASASDTDQGDLAPLKGAFYLRRHIDRPPRNFDEFRAALTRKQSEDLRRGLSRRSPTALGEPSGGYDFVVLAWPRHDREHDAIVVAFEGSDDSLAVSAVAATPNDVRARQRRAGPDATLISDKSVLIAGVGSVGGHVAVSLASSGIGRMRLIDGDELRSVNLVRHVGNGYGVGYKKTIAVAVTINDHAPWTKVEPFVDDLPYDPSALCPKIEGFDLIIDCTGTAPMTAALAEVCRRRNVPLITGALFHQGALARVQRQAEGDTLIAARPADRRYYDLPPEESTGPDAGFLELGCTAPVNNAPPTAVLATAADIAHAAIDFLTGRRQRLDERILVFQTKAAPFDRTGALEPTVSGGTA